MFDTIWNDLLQYVLDPFGNFLYDIFVFLVSRIIVFIFMILTKFLDFAIDIFIAVTSNLGISSHLIEYFSSIDAKYLQFITYLRIPDAINIIINAMITRKIIDLIPFSKF